MRRPRRPPLRARRQGADRVRAGQSDGAPGDLRPEWRSLRRERDDGVPDRVGDGDEGGGGLPGTQDGGERADTVQPSIRIDRSSWSPSRSTLDRRSSPRWSWTWPEVPWSMKPTSPAPHTFSSGRCRAPATSPGRVMTGSAWPSSSRVWLARGPDQAISPRCPRARPRHRLSYRRRRRRRSGNKASPRRLAPGPGSLATRHPQPGSSLGPGSALPPAPAVPVLAAMLLAMALLPVASLPPLPLPPPPPTSLPPTPLPPAPLLELLPLLPLLLAALPTMLQTPPKQAPPVHGVPLG
jgi:hypothetical protein